MDARAPGFRSYSTITRSVWPRPKVSGEYISSALGGGTTKAPGVVARRCEGRSYELREIYLLIATGVEIVHRLNNQTHVVLNPGPTRRQQHNHADSPA